MKPWNSFDGLGVIGIIPPTTFIDMFFNFCLVLTGEFTHVFAFLFFYFYFVAYFKNKIKKSLNKNFSDEKSFWGGFLKLYLDTVSFFFF